MQLVNYVKIFKITKQHTSIYLKLKQYNALLNWRNVAILIAIDIGYYIMTLINIL